MGIERKSGTTRENPPPLVNSRARSTYQFLLSREYFRPTILLIQFLGHVIRSMLLQTSLHAIDGAPAHFQAAVDCRGIKPGFEEFFDLLLNFGVLLATSRHFDRIWVFC